MNKLFSFPFYKDAMRRLRLSGLIFLFICLLFGLLPIMLNASNRVYFFAVQETTVVLNFYMFTGPVVLTFTAFSFLFKRSASDVYHALPLSRGGLYLSIASSVLTYVAGTVILTVGSAYLLMAMLGWPLDWGHFLPSMLSFLLGCILVTACALIGVSATGTRFSAFVVGGVVLFLPRFVTLLSLLIISETAPMLVISRMGLLFDASYNIPVSVFLSGGFGSLFGISGSGYGMEQVFLSVGPKVFTLLLSLAYIAAGGYIFHRRASETAGMSAPGRRTQHLYRCLIASPLFMLIGVTAVVTYDNWATGSYAMQSAFPVLITVALLIYFVYELITTRRWKNLLSALYVLPIPVVLTLGACLCVSIYGNAEQQRLPSQDEIASIQFYNDGRYDMSYQELVLHEQRFENPELTALVADGLSYSAKQESGSVAYVSRNRRIFRINLKNGGALYRAFSMPYQDEERFVSLINSDPGFITAIASLPAGEEILSYNAEGSPYMDDPNGNFARAVWASFQKEALRLDPMERSALTNSASLALTPSAAPAERTVYPNLSRDPAPLDYYISISGTHNGRRFRNLIYITTAVPETAALVMRHVNAGADTALIEATAASLATTPYEHGNVSMRLYNMDSDGARVHSESFDLTLGDAYAQKEGVSLDADKLALMQTLLSLDRGNVDVRKPFVRFNMRLSHEMGDGVYQDVYVPTVYAALDDAAIAQILDMFPDWFAELR